MPRLLKALDVSAHSGAISVSQWRKARDASWNLAIVQLWGGRPQGVGPNTLALRQLANARAAGLLTAAYIWIPPASTTDTSELMALAQQAAGPEWARLLFVAIDIEDPQHRRLHPTNPGGRLLDAISHVQDKTVGIYTSISMWPDLMGPDARFAGLFLWDAKWDGLASLDDGWVPYAGWTRRAAKQYQDTTLVAGFTADLNVVDLDRISGAAAPAPPDDDEAVHLRRRLAAIAFALGADWAELRALLDRHNLGH